MLKQLASKKIGDYLLVNLSGRNFEAVLTDVIYNGIYTKYRVKIAQKFFIITASQVVKNLGARLTTLKDGGLV